MNHQIEVVAVIIIGIWPIAANCGHCCQLIYFCLNNYSALTMFCRLFFVLSLQVEIRFEILNKLSAKIIKLIVYYLPNATNTILF